MVWICIFLSMTLIEGIYLRYQWNKFKIISEMSSFVTDALSKTEKRSFKHLKLFDRLVIKAMGFGAIRFAFVLMLIVNMIVATILTLIINLFSATL